MKILLLSLLVSFSAQAKDEHNFSCNVDKESKVELSLLDKSTPSVSLFHKKSKFATCQYENTPLTQMGNPRAQANETLWHLKLKKCDYYFEDKKEKIPVVEAAMFKQSHEKRDHYFLIVKGRQPLKCKAVK